MTVQERKNYNFIISILFSVGFFLFGGMALLWLFSELGVEFGPFPSLSAPFRHILTFVVYGAMGGWLIAGVVGGFWLGVRYVRRQGKALIAIACVLFPLTYIIFVYVGMFGAIPFAIYNMITNRRGGNGFNKENDKPVAYVDNAAHEMEKLEYFSLTCLATKEIYEELKWSFVSKTTIVFYIVMAFGLFWLGVDFILYEQYIIAVALYAAGISFIITLLRLPSQTINIIMARHKESFGTVEMRFTLLFADERINIYNIVSGAKSYMEYENIVKVVPSKSAYMLMSKASQFIIISKAALSEEQVNGELVRFLNDRCKNIKW